MKFRYCGEDYPRVYLQDGGYEEILVIIPEPTGDYFLSKITSFGKYELLEEIPQGDVEIIISKSDNNAIHADGEKMPVCYMRGDTLD